MTVVVLGEKGVGKTTFIENCFVSHIYTLTNFKNAHAMKSLTLLQI